MQTEGCNFAGVWDRADDTIEVHKITSNDIWAILCTYGVEMARTTILNEIQSVFNVYKINVDSRHIALIADYMVRLLSSRCPNVTDVCYRRMMVAIGHLTVWASPPIVLLCSRLHSKERQPSFRTLLFTETSTTCIRLLVTSLWVVHPSAERESSISSHRSRRFEHIYYLLSTRFWNKVKLRWHNNENKPTPLRCGPSEGVRLWYTLVDVLYAQRATARRTWEHLSFCHLWCRSQLASMAKFPVPEETNSDARKDRFSNHHEGNRYQEVRS
jgi:hypothetical protein